MIPVNVISVALTLATSTLNRNSGLAKRKTSALPELNLRADFITDDLNSIVTNANRDARLPILSKEDQTRISSKRLNDRRERLFLLSLYFPLYLFLPFLSFFFIAAILLRIVNARIIVCVPDKQCNIDCEVESTWRALREGRDWTKEKACIDNTCTTKWSEVIEKMTRDMDKIQKRYLNPRANRYLYKSATNVFKTAPGKSNFDKNAEIARSIIFPKKKTRLKSADINRSRNFDINMISKDMAQTRFDKATKNISTDEHSNENLLLSQFTTKTRSIHTNAYARNIDNDIGSVHTIANNCDEKQHASVTGQTFKDDGAKRTSIKAPIHEYLQNCIDEVRKLPNIEEDKAEERLRDIKPLANDIANILTSLDIGSFEFYEDLEKRDHICGDTQESAREDSEEPNIATNITQIMPVDTIRRNQIVNENASPENNSEFINAKTAGTSKQSNTTDCEDNFAFIKIGLNVQNKNVPKDKLSQILQSEYLRKDLFL